MKKFALFAAALMLTGAAHAAEFKVGDTVPATLGATDQNGKARTFGEARGHPLVLEWTNYGCPFVHKHYDSGNMQKLQSTYTGKGVTWFSVISSAEGKEGYLNTKDAPGAVAKMGFKGTAVLLDSAGTLGKAFDATNTPTMVVIDAEGKVVYRGAIDSIPSFSQDDIAKATNYVSDALDATLAGKPVAVATSKPYGCSVKY
ncbi:MAG TPA: redoxin family protein [Alphaproteobacteria bacterium]|nr:redoxin family protein [Alphaproteobacteria bacterium]